jgi:hypothetical protein
MEAYREILLKCERKEGFYSRGIYRFFFSLFGFTLAFVIFLPDISLSGEVWKNYTNNRLVNCLAIEGNHLWEATTGGVVRRNLLDPFK